MRANAVRIIERDWLAINEVEDSTLYVLCGYSTMCNTQYFAHTAVEMGAAKVALGRRLSRTSYVSLPLKTSPPFHPVQSFAPGGPLRRTNDVIAGSSCSSISGSVRVANDRLPVD